MQYSVTTAQTPQCKCKHYYLSLGPFHGAIAVTSVTRCRRRRRRHRCTGGARQYRWQHLVNGREVARSSEWAQHFSNASCSGKQLYKQLKARTLYAGVSTNGEPA